MFFQNLLIVTEDHRSHADFLSQLLEIGYKRKQITIATAENISFELNYEVIILLTERLTENSALILQLNKKTLNIPLIVVSEQEPDLKVACASKIDDWMLSSWVQPALLKKTIHMCIERKKNPYNMRTFNDNPTPMYIFENETFRFLEANKAALKQYGYSKEEFLSLSAENIRPQNELEAFYKINKDLPQAYSNAGIWQHENKNGERFYVHIFIDQILYQGKNCKFVMVFDIDRVIKAENEVHKKALEMENILESITDAFFTLNKNWELTYINKAFEKSMKLSRADVIGKNLWEAFPEASQLSYYEHYNKAVTEKTSVHFEEFYPPLGIWLSINAYPTASGLAIYFTDNTAQKNYQRKIESQNRQFKEIAWVQAHQIRGPVSNLLGLVDLFNFPTDDIDNQELLSRVKHTAIQMDESIKEIVYLTRKIES